MLLIQTGHARYGWTPLLEVDQIEAPGVAPEHPPEVAADHLQSRRCGPASVQPGGPARDPWMIDCQANLPESRGQCMRQPEAPTGLQDQGPFPGLGQQGRCVTVQVAAELRPLGSKLHVKVVAVPDQELPLRKLSRVLEAQARSEAQSGALDPVYPAPQGVHGLQDSGIGELERLGQELVRRSLKLEEASGPSCRQGREGGQQGRRSRDGDEPREQGQRTAAHGGGHDRDPGRHQRQGGAQNHRLPDPQERQHGGREQGPKGGPGHAGGVDPARAPRFGREGRRDQGTGEHERQQQHQIGCRQVQPLERLQGHAEVVQGHNLDEHQSPRRAGAVHHDQQGVPAGVDEGPHPAGPPTLEKGHQSAAGPEAEHHDADHHERQVMPLGKGKDPGKQHLDREGRQGNEEDRGQQHGPQATGPGPARSWARTARRRPAAPGSPRRVSPRPPGSGTRTDCRGAGPACRSRPAGPGEAAGCDPPRR